MSIKLSGTLTESDYLASSWLHLRLTRRARFWAKAALWVLCIAVALAVFGATLAENAGNSAKAFRGILVIGAVPLVWLALVHWHVRYKVRRNFSQDRSLAMPFHVEMTGEHIVLGNAQGSSQMRWPDLHKWREGPDCFILYRNDSLYHLLPKRLFVDAGDIEATRKILHAGIGAENS